jgi:ATP-dependent Clp protease ATP-binding subunit ClpC
MGFSLEGDNANDYERMKGKVNEELKKSFKPEFLNRVDETIVFPQLTKPELVQIVDLFVKRLAVRLEDRDLTIKVSQAAKDRLIEIGFDPTLGARPLRRAVQREIEDKLSERILHGELPNASDVTVDYNGTEFVFESHTRELAVIGAPAGVPAAVEPSTDEAGPDNPVIY